MKGLAVGLIFPYYMHVKRELILSVLMLLIWMAEVGASEPAGTRIQGLGGAGVALAGEANAIYWNPAAIFSQDRIALDVTLHLEEADWPLSWGFSYLNYSRSLQRGAGLGIYRTIVEADTSRSIEGGNATAALLATVYRTPIGIPLGISFKYIHENWAEEGRQNYFTGDVGIMAQWHALTLGVNFQSITQPKSEIYPYRVLAGGSLNWRDKAILTSQIGVETWRELEDPDLADRRIGLEIVPWSVLSVQAGWREIPGERYWTGGLGIGASEGTSRLYLGYHWHPAQDIDDRVYVSFGYSP